MVSDHKIWIARVQEIALVCAILALPYSIGLCHGALVVFMLSALYNLKRDAVKELFVNWLAWPFFAFAILHIAGLIYSRDLVAATNNLQKKIILFIVPMMLLAELFQNRRTQKMLRAFIVSCLAMVLICLIGGLYKILFHQKTPENFDVTTNAFFDVNAYRHASQYLSYQELVSPIGIHPTYAGIYLVFCVSLLPFVSWTYRVRIDYRIRVFLFIIFSAFIFLLSSRIVLVCWFLVVTGASFALLKSKVQRAFAVLALWTIAFSAVLVSPVTRYRSIDDLTAATYHIEPGKLYRTSSEIHFSLMWLAMKAAEGIDVVIGAGTGSTEVLVNETAATFRISNIINTSDPHNQFLHTFIALGFLGLTVLLSFFALPLFESGKMLTFLPFAFLCMMFLVCLTESFLESQKGIVFFSIFYPLICFHWTRNANAAGK